MCVFHEIRTYSESLFFVPNAGGLRTFEQEQKNSQPLYLI